MGTFLIAVVLAVGVNATNLMATKEYTDFSMRGKSELSFNADGTKNNGTASMPHDYITEYSYGVTESLNLIAPRLFGGSNTENVGTDSKLYEFIINQNASEDDAKEFVQYALLIGVTNQLLLPQPTLELSFFSLCVLALYHDKRKLKYTFLAGAILSLVLSWEKTFLDLPIFLLITFRSMTNSERYLLYKLYLELCIPVLAIMGLQSFFKDTENQKKSLLYTAATTIGLIALLFATKNMFSFTTENDGYYIQSYGKEMGTAFVDALKADRATFIHGRLIAFSVSL